MNGMTDRAEIERLLKQTGMVGFDDYYVAAVLYEVE